MVFWSVTNLSKQYNLNVIWNNERLLYTYSSIGDNVGHILREKIAEKKFKKFVE
jgi:hypothetical protein